MNDCRGLSSRWLLVRLASAFALALFVPSAQAQEPPEAVNTNTSAGPRTTLHGFVRNSASGEPLPRALVSISGDASSGALTDSDGRFEIPNVPVGPQELEIIKPGFMDPFAGAEGYPGNPRSFAHNVIVAVGMSDIDFTLAPVNSIHGVIQLSTGDPAHAIQVTLLRRTIQDGRVVWQTNGTTRTNSEGIYRFGGLADGTYALYTNVTIDSDAATDIIDMEREQNVMRSGFASVFYADARDVTGAAKIQLSGGQQAEVDVNLTSEPFHPVNAIVGFPTRARSLLGSQDGGALNVSVQVMDSAGHTLVYTPHYDATAQTVQALLPDGAYSFVVICTSQRSASSRPDVFSGQVDFSVTGHTVSNLRIPLAAVRTIPVQVTITRTGLPAAQGGDSGSVLSVSGEGITITLSQTGAWLSDGMVTSFAQGSSTGPLQSAYAPPGSYWVHTNIAQRGLCEYSFTAGGTNIAREPLTVGFAGVSVPLSLALRDDCASLKLSLPASMSAPAVGEEPFYTVYVVPDFDSTTDVIPQTLRASTGASITLTGLTPGDYHVYAFNRPRALEYRNPAVLSRLHGQPVTLSPGTSHELILEADRR
jgi:hypothetical protein